MQKYEFESKGFVDTSATKHVGATLIAPVVEAILVCSAPTNQALTADVKGKESSEKVSSVKVDDEEISLYTSKVVDELNKSLAISTDLKEAEKAFNERIEALTNDLAAMTDIKIVLEIQQEDLLAKFSTTKSELAEAKVHIDKYEFSSKAVEKLLHFQIHGKVKNGIRYKAVPHPFYCNFTYSPVGPYN
ncbi:hypothetical protein L1987_15079 [Smallanthus sonchifolius]|uniref:Uncharacterized protein n=1 Tax=Smallanthus sonchifolius TaxID=185202 RepID=A0ACB9J830_9ASTR|nr:hypothetical protein L1987_15079 [Smallanthus sonchifolius]